MPDVNLDKIFKVLDKLNSDELYAAMAVIKDFVAKKLIAEQKVHDDKSSEIASKISKLNGD